MTTYEKIKNQYNVNMKPHLGMETSSPHYPPSQDLQVEEEEDITPNVRKVAPKKRIRYKSIDKRKKKWKANPLNIGSIQVEQERRKVEEKEEKRKQDEFLWKKQEEEE